MNSNDKYTIDQDKREEAIESIKRETKRLKNLLVDFEELKEMFEANDINAMKQWDVILYRLDWMNVGVFSLSECFEPVPSIQKPFEGPKSSLWSLKIENEGYCFKLPLFTSQRKSNFYNGEYISALVEALLLEHIDEVTKLGFWERADIKFIHHLDITSGMNRKPDPDNMDVKKAIDKLQHFLIIPDDNLLCVNLSHETVLDSENFTEMKVTKLPPLL